MGNKFGAVIEHMMIPNIKEKFNAMAGAIFSDNAKNYALKQGLYIIEQSGDTVKITEPSGENKAKAW